MQGIAYPQGSDSLGKRGLSRGGFGKRRGEVSTNTRVMKRKGIEKGEAKPHFPYTLNKGK